MKYILCIAVLLIAGCAAPPADLPSYYINFQNPAGEPSADPLIVDGKTFLKVGWEAYDAEKGYGWSGSAIDDPSRALYNFSSKSGYSAIQRSVIYDDYGRQNVFEINLPNGEYSVSIGIGIPEYSFAGPQNITIEGQKLFDDYILLPDDYISMQTATVNLTDNTLTFVVDGWSVLLNDYSANFISYIKIESLN
ncbi:MAG: hypothetical protein JW969_21465 [Spirochaetales bacterium]|nr:hypothetical protein [Spirochaetales bacterium]